ncbi:response regulator of citrate/malate metabolism [Arthrobacter sp. SLBN-83]|uniref:response regulator n=1 Tax=Arthrobacter sp. SLBN-83 TaxID=2768449 RepID=UPI001153504D|nr:response regulator [Arthrobacter sp. SLBN-83]TQJ61465.1 response regulator of citrate/malate metabolism [Arthrobacter sp. SLBN-83]
MISVLIVEDDFRVAGIHSRFVNQTDGFHAIGTVHNGKSAREAVQKLRPDLILLDVHLPDANGLDLLREWRTQRVPVGVIIITAATEAHSVRDALEGGAVHYIIKPFEYEDLVAQLQRFRDQVKALSHAAAAGQEDINKIFGYSAAPLTETLPVLPKGLSAETAALVAELLGSGKETSASDCADALGISRVSVRRYLEYFADTGRATVRLEYGRAGRPERKYRRR